ncbi:MAG: hypothetical protein GPJ54_17460 [Candidatus Heimdallarchaeota archaeon]|nr:hypothetical protein [Candidatus Heimdallarchaeota archaeon]
MTEGTQLKVDLKDEHYKYFTWFREEFDHTTNAETIRYIIVSAFKYENSIFKWIEDFSIDKIKHIEQVIDREDVKIKYKIYSMSDFLHCAIDDLFNNITNNLKNILDWEVKSILLGVEKEVALAFEEAYHKNGKNGISMEQIMEQCDNKCGETVFKVLNGFVSKGYITSIPYGDKSQYNVLIN